MKKILLFISLFASIAVHAQLSQGQGATTGNYPLLGKWHLKLDPVSHDSTDRLINSRWFWQNVPPGGGTGVPVGTNGDLQMKNGANFAASLLNQSSLQITYRSDSFFNIKSVNNPNQSIGLQIKDSAGNVISGFRTNPALGTVDLGGFRAGYIATIWAGGAERGRFTPSGLNLGYMGEHGEELYVLGQSYLNGLIGLGAAPVITAGVVFPAATTPSASFNITTGVQPTVGHTGDCYSDGTHGYIYMGGAWRQIDQQSAGGSPPFDAITAILMDHTDNTKTLKFALASITTGTARTLTVPNTSLTIAGIDISQTYTGTQTFNITNADIAKVGGLYPFVGNVVTSGAISLDWHTLTVDATSGNITLTLPSAASGSAFLSTGDPHGLDLVFIKTDAGANTVTITVNNTGTETINGATTFVLTTQWQACHIACVSTTKWIKY